MSSMEHSSRTVPGQDYDKSAIDKRDNLIRPELISPGAENDDSVEWPLEVQIKQEPQDALDEEESNSGGSGLLFHSTVEHMNEGSTKEEPLVDEPRRPAIDPTQIQNKAEKNGSITSEKRKLGQFKPGKVVHKCGECDKTFSQVKKLLQHAKFHTGERPYGCDVCGMAFIQLAAREAHLQRHDSSHVPFVCSLCGFVAESGDGYKAHMSVHTGQKPYNCDTCGKSFLCKQSRSMHVLTHTAERKNLKCRACGRMFSYRSSLVEHEKTHSSESLNPDDKKNFDCFCGRASFASLGGLRIHQRLAHTTDRAKKNVVPLPFLFSDNLRQ